MFTEMPTRKKREVLSEEPTRFGKWVLEHQAKSGISIQGKGGLCSQLGLLYDGFHRITHGPYTPIHLAMVIEMARIFGVSPLEPLFMLYDQQQIAATYTETERRLYSQMITFFDLFYRMDERSIGTVLSLMEGMSQGPESRPLSHEQEKFIRRLRMSPAGGAGNAKIEERQRTNQKSSPDRVVLSDELVFSGTEES
jgi:hypothetical protein